LGSEKGTGNGAREQGERQKNQQVRMSGTSLTKKKTLPKRKRKKNSKKRGRRKNKGRDWNNSWSRGSEDGDKKARKKKKMVHPSGKKPCKNPSN